MFSLCNVFTPALGTPAWWGTHQGSLVQHADVEELQVPLGFAVALGVSGQICTLRMNGKCVYLSWERLQLPRCWTSGGKAKTTCFPFPPLIIKSTQKLYHSSSAGRWDAARVSS